MNINGTRLRDDQENLLPFVPYSMPASTGPEAAESVSRKLYFEAGRPYLFEDYFIESGGKAFSSIGLIYHGQNKDYNLVHDPVQESYNDVWAENNYRIQVVSEKQRHGVSSTKMIEKHRIRKVEGDSNNIKFALRWDNSNGQFKDTPISTFDQFRQNNGERIKTLIQGQCATTGNMNVVAQFDYEVPGQSLKNILL